MINKLSLFVLLVLLPSFAFAEEINVTVKGMVCSFCAQGIKKTFSKVDGVKSVNVDLEKKIVKLSVDDAKTLSDEIIKSTINDAGYEVLSIERAKNA